MVIIFIAFIYGTLTLVLLSLITFAVYVAIS